MKYDVKFSCGHEETVQLFGKHIEREHRIAWYESCGSCSECRRATKMAEPIKAHVNYDIDNNSYRVALSGHTYDRKEEIKKCGFKWSIDRWLKYEETEEKCHETITMLEQSVDAVIETVVSDKIEKNKKLAAWNAAREAEKQAKVDAVKATKPEKPECIASGYWNGKLYGSNKGLGWKRVYIDNNETHLTPEQVAEIEAYNKAMEKYKKKLQLAEMS